MNMDDINRNTAVAQSGHRNNAENNTSDIPTSASSATWSETDVGGESSSDGANPAHLINRNDPSRDSPAPQHEESSSNNRQQQGSNNDGEDRPSHSLSDEVTGSAHVNESSSSSSIPIQVEQQQEEEQRQQQSQESNGEAEENRRRNNNNPPIVLTVIAMIWQLSKLWFRFLFSTMTFTIPTKYLHIISIILLCVHQVISKIIKCIPHFWLAVFNFVGYDNIPPELQSLMREQYGFRYTYPGGNNMHIVPSPYMQLPDTKMSEIAIFKRILEITVGQIMLAPKSEVPYEYQQQGSGSNSNASAGSSLLALLEKPIVSIMIPTTILSIFLLITMTVFLLIHIIFQAFIYISSYFANDNYMSNNDTTNDNQIRGGRGAGGGNDNNDRNRGSDATIVQSTSVSSSPFVLWGILSILILETALPWICLSVGIYLSFSLGGFVFLLFVIFMCFLYFGLRRLRNRITIGFQEGGINAIDANNL